MDFIQTIKKNGGESYLVGGINRDRLFNILHKYNKMSKDYDIMVTGMELDNLVNILKEFGKVKEVGKSFGVITFNPNKSHKNIMNFDFDIALPRKEISTGKNYKDFEIVSDPFIPIEIDLERRDATINAIAYKIHSVEDMFKINLLDNDNIIHIIDPFNGLNDIKTKIWKAVGDPYKRFLEDPTRIMRAIRQCSQLGLELEDETKNAILEHSDLIQIMLPSSAVRLTNELIKLLMGKMSHVWIDFIINESGLGKFLLFDKNIAISDKILECYSKKLNIEQTTTIFLLMSLNYDYQRISDWIILFQLAGAPYYCKSKIKFIHIASENNNWNFDNILNCENQEEQIKLFRKLIVSVEGHDNVKMLIDIYGVIKNAPLHKITFLNNLVETNSDTILSPNYLAFKGNEIIQIYGLIGRDIGKLKEWIFDKVVLNEIPNDFNKIKQHIDSFYF
jgi:tRNA nucleotidyltransferase/poly(A) polymerase